MSHGSYAILRRLLRRSLAPLREARAAQRERKFRRMIARGQPRSGEEPRVFYGFEHVPGVSQTTFGGMVKSQGMQHRFPNSPYDFNILYLVSSFLPRDCEQLIELAEQRAAPLVWNQNGVAYPAWAGANTDQVNAPRVVGLRSASHVVYQSAFCKLSSDAALGEPRCSWDILHNPVDTRHFTPARSARPGFIVLVGGNQYERYRFESALRAFAVVADARADARLLVTGRVFWETGGSSNLSDAVSLATRLGIADRIEFVGTYTQAEAPNVIKRAHLLLHTKVNDPCPTVVLEAMACGLPVVYSASGGTPELVGDEAGIGIPTPVRWDEIRPPDPSLFGEAVLEAVERLSDLGQAARERAVRNFDLRPWLDRHASIFEEVLTRR